MKTEEQYQNEIKSLKGVIVRMAKQLKNCKKVLDRTIDAKHRRESKSLKGAKHGKD